MGDRTVGGTGDVVQIDVSDGAATEFAAGAAIIDPNGAKPRAVTVIKNVAAQAVTAGTAVAVWTPASGKKYRIMGASLSLSVAGEILLKETTAGSEFLRTPALIAAAPYSFSIGNGILATTANDALAIDVSASGTVNGFVFGAEE